MKLEHALREFQVDVTGLVAADFGCNVGGFTDCLLRHGARRVYAVDTGYGMLDYHLRRDERVVVMERTNALHAPPPDEPIDLVVIDAGWTPQRLIVPAAQRWLRALSPPSGGTSPRADQGRKHFRSHRRNEPRTRQEDRSAFSSISCRWSAGWAATRSRATVRRRAKAG